MQPEATPSRSLRLQRPRPRRWMQRRARRSPRGQALAPGRGRGDDGACWRNQKTTETNVRESWLFAIGAPVALVPRRVCPWRRSRRAISACSPPFVRSLLGDSVR